MTFSVFYEKYGNNQFTKDEYRLIYNVLIESYKISKTDIYTDLNRIKKEIQQEKIINNSELENITFLTNIDSIPPYNLYKYEFHKNKQDFKKFIDSIEIIPIDDLLKSNY
jgi:hypothetical protein